MKRKIILILALALVLSVFAACAKITTEKQGSNHESMFVLVETAPMWRIVYHKDTRVMYAVSYTSNNCGNFTLLVDADGKPLLWDGGNGLRGTKEATKWYGFVL